MHRKNVEDKSLVKATDIHYNRCATSLCSIDFSLKNDSNYPIKNITVLFVYRKHIKEYPEDHTQLLLDGKYEEYKNMKPIKEWDEVISYSAAKIKETILPKLALQFNHQHSVRHFYYKLNFREEEFITNAFVEIRILDYEIVRAIGYSPENFLLK